MALIAVGVLLVLTPPPPPSVDYGGYLPHYQGPGTTTPGGRGGPICIVATLADDRGDTFVEGMGTLRQCTGRRPGCDDTPARCARFALVAVSGTVDLLNGGSTLYITDPFLTLACQTAPTGREGTGDTGVGGFTIKGAIVLATHDAVVQHCRVRLLKAWGEAMTINIGDPITEGWKGHDVVLDHISTSWGTISGNVSMNFGATNVTVLDSLIAEPIRRYPNDGQYGYGSMFYSSDDCRFTLARSYLAHQQVRNPLTGSGCHGAILDNLIYDAGDNYWASQGDAMAGNAISLQGLGQSYAKTGFEIVVAGNTVVNGPVTSTTVNKVVGVALDEGYVKLAHKVYLQDNTGPGLTADDQDAGVQYFGLATNKVICDRACFDSGFGWFKKVNYARLPPESVPESVLAHAGAFVTDRDAVDLRLVADYRAKTGDAQLDSEADVGGFPPIAARQRAIPLPANPSAIHTATDFGRGFRTELEYFLAKDPAFGAERLTPADARSVAAPEGTLALASALLAVGLRVRKRRD